MILSSLISILEVLLVTVPALLTVAFVTVAERKTMASMQRRLGPNLIGYYGLLQAFADALKLLLKEYVSPTQSNFILFFLGPVITLIFSLLSFAVIPYAAGLTILDLDLGILYLLAVSSLATYGILLAGWSANSKYAFLGSLRSTAQLISYELILSSAVLIVILLTGSLNLTFNIESQKAVWLLFPLFPIFIVFFIACIAETNRAPFDLAEAESELVSGFMTEHAAVIFVFFFLAEYASIVLICILTSILFLGGYLIDVTPLIYLFNSISNIFEITILLTVYLTLNIFTGLELMADWLISNLYFIFNIKQILIYIIYNEWYGPNLYETELYKSTALAIDSLKWEISTWLSANNLTKNEILSTISSIVINFNTLSVIDTVQLETNYISIFNNTSNNFISGLVSSIILGVKSSMMIFTFIWARASFPRIRFDQLMSFCWTVLLPIVVAFIILVPCILYGFDILPNNISLL
jgi:NADH:ubiquinone oxidoreductase subunit H